jgi:hypothetical protein
MLRQSAQLNSSRLLAQFASVGAGILEVGTFLQRRNRPADAESGLDVRRACTR